MQLDTERVSQKIAHIREQVTLIKALLNQQSKEEILGNTWTLRGVKYSLQTAIESVIDIAYHISAKQLQHAPLSSRDAMSKLAEAGIISRSDLRTYGAMVSLRNRLVHGYLEVDNELLYQVICTDLGDLQRFADDIEKLLAEQTG